MKKNRLLDYPAKTGWHKLFLVMKLTTFLVLALILNVTAAGYSQNSKVSVNVENGTLSEIFSQIEAQSNYRFFYQNEQILNVDRKSVDVNDKNVEELVKSLLSDTGLSYKFVDRNIIIFPKSDEATFAQQQISVSGKVTDSGNAPLPGVTVVIKGTTNGTVTDADGKYSLSDVPGDGVLVFSFVGMKSQEIDVAGQTIINVVLQDETIGLQEVVAIGYGTQRKEAVTGSVASVRGDVIREVASSSVSQSLQGRVAGVNMTQVSSRPGANMQIRIRGTRSLTEGANDPLVVLNGIPFAGSLNDINPNDIKSVDILKDASATAVYGSRGSNGVILITTFTGESTASKKPKVSYNGYYGVKDLMNKYPMMNAQEFIAFRDEAIKNGASWQYGADEDKSISTDWQDLMFQKSMVTSHDLGISGSTNGGGYSFGAGYYDENSVLPGQEYERLSLRGSFDQKIGDHVKVGISSISSFGITDGGGATNGQGYNPLSSILSVTPITNPYNTDGSIKTDPMYVNNLDTYYNPLMLKSLGDRYIDERKTFASYNSLYGEVQLLDGLKYHINLGLNYRQNNYGNFSGAQTPVNANDLSNATIENALTQSWVVENLLYYDKVFADKHRIGLVAMYSAEQTEYNLSKTKVDDIAADYLQFYNLGLMGDNGTITINPDDQKYYKRGLNSLMFRGSYSFDDKYMLTATLRSDASSVLAPGHKWHTYPAVSLGWNVTNEDFMKSVSWLNYLKLRVGYGQTSNQAIAPYQTLGSLATNYYNFGSQNVSGYYVSKAPNKNLGWEYTSTWNYGLDFHVLNNRLSGTLEYYTQHTKDVLIAQSLPRSSGVTDNYQNNIGETQNNGVELSLNAKIIKNSNSFYWNLGFNIYANRNELVALASGQQYDKGNGWFVGYPIDVIYDFKKIGIWQLGEEDKVKQYEGSTGQVGMIKVEYTGDYNADGTPTRLIGTGTTLKDDDRQILGSIEPKFQGGFNTEVGYKGFQLSVIGSYKKGGLLVSSIHSSSSYLNMDNGRRGQIKIDYWTPDNPTNAYPKPYGPEVSNNPKYASTLSYFDASYVKITNITLAYNFKKTWWLNKLKMDNLRVYVTAQNPFVFASKYYSETGLDPQPNSLSDNTQTQTVVPTGVIARIPVVGFNTPATRNYLFGLNVTF